MPFIIKMVRSFGAKSGGINWLRGSKSQILPLCGGQGSISRMALVRITQRDLGVT